MPLTDGGATSSLAAMSLVAAKPAWPGRGRRALRGGTVAATRRAAGHRSVGGPRVERARRRTAVRPPAGGSGYGGRDRPAPPAAPRPTGPLPSPHRSPEPPWPRGLSRRRRNGRPGEQFDRTRDRRPARRAG